MRGLLILALYFCVATSSIADDRLLVEAKVNGKAVLLAFDTGTEVTTLFRQAARRLDLEVTDPSPDVKIEPGKVALGSTEECLFQVGDSMIRTRLRVFDAPQYLKWNVDGFLGWADAKNTILWISADRKKLSALSALPDDMGLWAKWDLGQDSPILAITLPIAPGAEGTILIDTGSPYGVALSPKQWKKWRDEHRACPLTLAAAYFPAIGLRVYEQSWADNLAFGRFSITNVPVMPAPPVWERAFTNYQATLGLFALTRMDVIIDGKNAAIYTRPNPRPASRYEYNRLGAVFVPAVTKSDELVAHVAENSSAQEAGIRNGDVLRRIGDLDVTKWRTDSRVLPLARFWSRPAGTELELTLMRNGRPVNVVVVLKEIFPQVKLRHE